MIPKIKILFCITTQFGYHTDTYKYCRYLNKSKYDIHYLGFDLNYPHKYVEDCVIHYVPTHKNILTRYFQYLNSARKIIKKEKFNIIFYVDSQVTFILRLMNLFTFSILDVRTGDTHFNGRFSIFNAKILITSMFFKKVTVISKELQRLLYLPTRKCHILPLGGEPMKISHKNTETLNLLYIGTLVDRNIHLTISGISIFCKEYPDVAVNYEIVGDGRAKDVNLLLEYINLYNLNDIIKYHGYKDHDQAKELFEKANLGIVFIPLNKGYLYQPSTKLYEFLIVGIPVIATRTIDNLNRVTEKEGIIIDDNPESFAKGLGIFYSKKNNYDIESIKNEFREFSWEKIVKNNLEPYFESMINYN